MMLMLFFGTVHHFRILLINICRYSGRKIRANAAIEHNEKIKEMERHNLLNSVTKRSNSRWGLHAKLSLYLLVGFYDKNKEENNNWYNLQGLTTMHIKMITASFYILYFIPIITSWTLEVPFWLYCRCFETFFWKVS